MYTIPKITVSNKEGWSDGIADIENQKIPLWVCEGIIGDDIHWKEGRRPNQKPTQRKTKRVIGEYYTSGSYRRAIQRACDLANVPRWHPHQLRHNAGTNIRKEFGLEAAQVMLGHSEIDTTQIYAEVNQGKAVLIASKIG